MHEEIKNQARTGSPSCNWYLNATELVPHPVNRNISRKLAVIIHRLRLGYKTTWQIIEGAARPCNYCNNSPDAPLLHYLLECPQTASLRENIDVPDIQNPESYVAAAKIAKNIIESLETHGGLLLDMPPPR